MSNQRINILRLFLLILFCTNVACREERTEEAKLAVIEIEVKKRIDRLMATKYERCQNELFAQASIIVDSILIARAKAQKDTIAKPPRPVKPDKPDAFLLEDDFSVKPLLRDSSEIENDSNIEY